MKYLTAEQLKVTPEERKALLKVKRFLKSLPTPGNVASKYEHDLEEVVNESSALFNMTRAIQPYDCGTAGCVGGWMYIYMRGISLKKKVTIPIEVAVAAALYVKRAIFSSSSLGNLFYPVHINQYDSITPQQAVSQVETFLKTGHATW